MRKISVALESKTAEAAAKSAAKGGRSLSAWLNDAAESALAVEEGLLALAEWEAEHGALSKKELAAADRVLDRMVAPSRARRAS